MRHIFIDRDGVINKDPGGWTRYNYVTKWEEFNFLPGVFEALKLLRDSKVSVIVISNQAGVNKGYFSRGQLNDVTNKMISEIIKNGGDIEKVYYCTHTDEDNCLCRKPKTGLLEKASARHRVDLHKTYFIGDSLVDIIAGRRAGLKTIFILSGKTTRAEMERWDEKPDYTFDDLLSAVRWVVKKTRRRTARATRRNV